MKVRCERDGTEFEAVPRKYPSEKYPFSVNQCQEEGYAFPCRVIDCPTCVRGYFQETDGRWVADRPLTVLEVE